MTPEIEATYDRIGDAARAQAGAAAGRILIYAEGADGAISADLFFLDREGVVQYRYGGDDLFEAVEDCWDRSRAADPKFEWRAMAFVIDGRTFDIDLTYLDQADPDGDIADRRRQALFRYFGTTSIGYSNPDDGV